MKKHYYVLLGLFLLVIIVFTRTPTPKTDLILNRLTTTTTMPTLHYSNLSGEKVLSFVPTPQHLAPKKQKNFSFTEGFIPLATYTFYTSLLKDSLDTYPVHGLYNFYEDDAFTLLAYGTSLEEIYIIEKNTAKVHSLSFPAALDLGPMYVFHVQRVGNTLMLLSGEYESYTSLLYKIHLPTFEVVDAIRLTTHPSSLGSLHSALTSFGAAVFIHDKSLKIYDLLTNTYKLVPLDYVATAVIDYQDQILALGQVDAVLHYTLLDHTGLPTQIGKFTLPSATSTPVDFVIDNSIFYLVTYDPKGNRYCNYLTLYDLQTGEILYSLGIQPLKGYALLGLTF